LVLAVIVGSVAGQLTGTDTETQTTPVPILRYLDRQNDDGSYTFGYEAADGTYKIEKRLTNGEITGKYGYIDANGDLQETVYDGTVEHGFAPQIGGVVVGRPQAVKGTRHNKIPVKDREARPGSRFALYKARKAAKEADLVEALPAVEEEPDYNDVDVALPADVVDYIVNNVAAAKKPQPRREPVKSQPRIQSAQPQPRREPAQSKPRFANFRASNRANNRQAQPRRQPAQPQPIRQTAQPQPRIQPSQPQPRIQPAQPQPRREPAQSKPRFANFRASNSANNRKSIFHNKNIKMVNGRRAVLKKRIVVPKAAPARAPAPVPAPAPSPRPIVRPAADRGYVQSLSPAEKLAKRQEEETAWQQELRILEATRKATFETHQHRYNIADQAAKENLGYTFSIYRLDQPQQQLEQQPLGESLRSQDSQEFNPWTGRHFYVSNYDSSVGRYTYQY